MKGPKMQIAKITHEELVQIERMSIQESNELAERFAREQPELIRHLNAAVDSGLFCAHVLTGALYCFTAIVKKLDADQLEELFKLYAK